MLAHKSKDIEGQYCNPHVAARVDGYKSMVSELHGPEYVPEEHPIDPVAVMMAGGGKKHGRYWLADSLIDTASTPTLTQIRSQSTSSTPSVRPRPSATSSRLSELQVSPISFILPGLYMLAFLR